MSHNRIRYITRAGVIAAIYVILTTLLGERSFGPIQFRVSEALTILPFLDAAAIPGVFVGCLLANVLGGYGLIDIVFGSLTTLAAAYITSKMPNRIFAAVPPIVLNSLIVSIWVSRISNWPYWPTVVSIGLGELISVAVFGNLLLVMAERIRYFK